MKSKFFILSICLSAFINFGVAQKTLKKPVQNKPVLPTKPIGTSKSATTGTQDTETKPTLTPQNPFVNENPIQGQNCFNTVFNNAATGRDLENAYLLNYLSTMVYPQYIRYTMNRVLPETNPAIVHIQFDHEDFRNTFEQEMFHLFTPKGIAEFGSDVTIDFVHKCQLEGFDPEAMIVSTPTTVFVIFRGTDRVNCATTEFGYNVWEWTQTDFDFNLMDPGVSGISGKVHSGFWKCLNLVSASEKVQFGFDKPNFINILSDKVKSYSNNGSKKIWITGHSLGGAEAQLFAVYLKAKHNLTARGLYVYSSAHPGDRAFVAQLNSIVGKSNIQRFEFSEDPVPHGGPQAWPESLIDKFPHLVDIRYGRAGIRNFFRDLNTPIVQKGEDNPMYDLSFFINGAGNQIASATTFSWGIGGAFCMHHPTFPLFCLRKEILRTNPSLASQLPPEVPLPLVGDNCTQIDIKLANHFTAASALEGVAGTVSQALQDIQYSLSLIVTNSIGVDDLPKGKYHIRNYGYMNNPTNYIDWLSTCMTGNEEECPLALRSVNSPVTANQVFDIDHDAFGYTFSIGGQRMEVEFAHKGDEGAKVWMKNKFDPDVNRNQHWLLYKIPGKTRTYLVYNNGSFKCLSVDARCNGAGSNCKLFQYNAIDSKPTQVWVFEPVDSEEDLVDRGAYYIKSVLKPEKCLTVNKADVDADAGKSCHLLELNDKFDNSVSNQKFIIEVDPPSGAYKIRNMYRNISEIIDADLGIPIGSGDRIKGAHVNVCKDGNPDFDRHLWFFDKQADGTYFIKLKKDPNFVLDVADAQVNGSLLFTFRRGASDVSQRWILEKVQ